MIDKQRLGTFVLGGAVGVLAGILLAPRSGRELRGSIADRAGEARDRGRESYFETQERLRERFAEMGEAEPRRPVGTEEVSVGPAAGDPEYADPYVPAPEAPPVEGLRDVSRETHDEDAPRDSGDRSEELRRKVRETRDRLRRRADDSGGGPA
ncbi:MAG: YtxH domain-containing protein [Actinomycetota bacterium]|nr:YtxH domain-containing protein [Actinomycetota bacterium]